MKLRNEARILQRKALSSLRTATTAFNSPDDDGRVTSVLLALQHAFEMLLKAALAQSRIGVFDRRTGRALSFESCIRQAQQAARIRLSDEEAGTLRTINAMRDDEQHWFNVVDEGILYLHARAAVTLFDDLLHRVFGERLATHLPLRVLPIGVDPPQEFMTLVDHSYANIARLLKPGRRARADAHGHIRTLLALEAHAAPDTHVSVTDVKRVETAIRAGKSRSQVFPKLNSVASRFAGDGHNIQVRFVKQDGLPVRLVRDGEPAVEDAAAYREVDQQKKFHRSAFELAKAVNLSAPKSAALRDHLGIDDDERFRHVFEFGSSRHRYYSDNAFTAMRDALANGLDMGIVWAAHRPRGPGNRSACQVPGCNRVSRPRSGKTGK